ncbi:MAG: L-threonylcarbamoyladenylate synthase [Burkholderiaceae bacterium]|nr:L-threonylcarbamoyladenylate synthase [Burkholderiaceae bacterium]
MTLVRAADAAAIEDAAARLARGEPVVFPTETVYGIGADAANRDAVAAVYRIKQRPSGHPLIVHVLDGASAQRWAEWSRRAQRLTEAFWPGPLTLILKRAPDAPAWACGQESTIGLRAPAHPVARALLHAFARHGGAGIAAPSANRFGRISPTRAEHVVEDLGEDAPLILDGGPCEVGVESTIVDLSRGRPVLLRPGGIPVSQLAAVLGEQVLERDAHAPRVSGTLDSHYAPLTPVEMVDADEVPGRVAQLRAEGRRVALWARSVPTSIADVGFAMARDARTTAHELYDTLRRLDRSGCDRIVIERVPRTPEWRAVGDRLRRAAAAGR